QNAETHCWSSPVLWESGGVSWSSWSTVCDADFDQQDAEVVCRELDCGIPVTVLGSATFGRGESQVWTEELQCRKTESDFSFCPTSSSLKHSNWSHDDDVGLTCSGHTEAQLVNGSYSCSGRVELQYLRSSMAFHEGRVQLSGGSECRGEVEIYVRQNWSRVLLDSWSLSEASVLCRQLGCGSVLNYCSFPSTTEHKHMCVTGFSCSGSEAHLGNCSSAQAEPVNCSSGDQLYITAQVVCRQLQCGVALSTHIPAWFGPGTGSIWLNEVECEGNETSLWNFRFQLCEEGECGHHEDVGVVCSEFKEIRLTEGCEGNLEVFYNGTWGNVCHNQMDDETMMESPHVHKKNALHFPLRNTAQWNIRNAQVVCRQLGCGSALSADGNVSSGSGEGTIWLNRVKCRGDEIHLWDCHHSLKKHTDCSHAGVTCADIPTVSTATPTTTTTTTITTPTKS
ncbi:hypothetical protein QTP70_015267, partial [Hemibagrus guttatus]